MRKQWRRPRLCLATAVVIAAAAAAAALIQESPGARERPRTRAAACVAAFSASSLVQSTLNAASTALRRDAQSKPESSYSTSASAPDT